MPAGGSSSAAASASSASLVALPEYPWVDSFFGLAILMALPNWLATCTLLMYIILINNDIFNHLLETYLDIPSYGKDSRVKNRWYISLTSLITFIVIDSLGMTGLMILLPRVLPYMMMFAKSLVVSKLLSSRQRFLLDSMSSCSALVLVEYFVKYFMSNLVPNDGEFDIDYDPILNFKNSSSISKRLMYYYTNGSSIFTKSTDLLILNFDFIIQFLNATLSLYIIMHNINPILRKTPVINKLYVLFDKLLGVDVVFEEVPKVSSTANTRRNRINNQQQQQQSREIAQNLVINVPDNISESSIPKPTLDSQQSRLISYLTDPQIIVRENFKNFSILSRGGDYQSDTTNRNLGSNKIRVSPSRSRSRSPNGLRRHTFVVQNSSMMQSIWSFFIGLRTMLKEVDYYSGDYFSHNSLTIPGYYSNNDRRTLIASPQCFIWYVGETSIGFELNSISLEQLLIKVNGIIWSHVSNCRIGNKELVLINGLSPLYQYDIELIKITINGELIHLSTNTISTVFENRLVTDGVIQSPITTMQNSITTTQEAISREKIKLKKLKTDWRKRCTQLKSEIESLNSRSTQTDESRNYKRLDNLRGSISQIEKRLNSVSQKLDEITLEEIEIDDIHHEVKKQFDNKMRFFQVSENEFNQEIELMQDQINNLMSENSQIDTKIEKLINKKLKFQSDVQVIEEWISATKNKLINEQRKKREQLNVQHLESVKKLKLELSS